MIVEEIMTRKVITIKSSDTLYKAQGLMVKNSIRHLPVVQGKELEGIITESDIRGAFVQNTNGSSKITVLDPKQMKVADFMTRDPQIVQPDTNIEDAALLIYKNKIGSLPVVDDEKLVGIISILDMLGLFIDYCFERFTLRRISTAVPVYNRASIIGALRAVFKKEGLVREGLVVQNEPIDLVLLGILREEWKCQQQ